MGKGDGYCDCDDIEAVVGEIDGVWSGIYNDLKVSCYVLGEWL
jgi:hypothetical protein